MMKKENEIHLKKFKEQLAEDLCHKSYTLDTLQTEKKTEQEDSTAVSKPNIPKHLVAYVMCPKIEIVSFAVPLIIESVPISFVVLAVLIDHFCISGVAFYNINISNFI